MKVGKILIACEMSGIIREAFSHIGWDAWSCDLQDTVLPGKHIKSDVLDILGEGWDLMIAHPPCTYLTITGNKWFLDPSDKNKPHPRFPDRLYRQKKAVTFFMELNNAPIPHIAIENPIGFMSTFYRKADQIIHPYQFGHNISKATCLWLKNLPLLRPTEIVEPEMVILKSGKKMAKWYADSLKLPQAEWSNYRSKTFQGIANAMATQWGDLSSLSLQTELAYN